MLDKGHVAGEQSSRNWGWCRQQHRDLRELPLAMKSVEIWGDFNRELGTETGFRRTGLGGMDPEGPSTRCTAAS